VSSFSKSEAGWVERLSLERGCSSGSAMLSMDAMEAYLKTFSDRTIRNIFWSANNYALPKRSAKIGAKITYWYGDDEKKDRRRDIRFIKRYFPQTRIHGIPKMAHAELVMVHPEEFCRYAERFLIVRKEKR
jgi:hypothetical protein